MDGLDPRRAAVAGLNISDVATHDIDLKKFEQSLVGSLCILITGRYTNTRLIL